MSDMWRDISTLTRVFTTLTHTIVNRSKKHGSGGYKSNGGYVTDESENEISRQLNTKEKSTKWRRSNLA